MKNKPCFVALIVASLLFCSCQEKMGMDQWLSMVDRPDGGFVREKVLGDKTIRLQYLPPEYLAAKQLGTDPIQAQVWKEYLEKFNGSLFFSLKIRDHHSPGADELIRQGGLKIPQMDPLFSDYQMKQNLSLKVNDQSFQCEIFNRIPGTELEGWHTWMIGFPVQGLNSDVYSVLFSPSQLGNSQNLEFPFQVDSVSKKPIIDFII